MSAFSYEDIYELVRCIPRGRVATYGQIAHLAGFPRHARQVGYALAALRDSHENVPWQRVVNANGAVSRRADPSGDDYQRILLEAEGVKFDNHGRLSLSRFQWQPAQYSKSGS